MSTEISHCSLSYHELELDLIEPFAVTIRDGVYNNDPPFTGPPLTQAQFDALIDNYVNKRGAYLSGGQLQKGAFLMAKNSIMAGLDQTAEFVDGIALGDVPTILLSGFTPTKTEDTPSETPAQPQNVELKRGVTGELLAECSKVPGAQFYGCLMFAAQTMPANASFNGLGQFVVQDETPPAIAVAADNPFIFFHDVNKNRKKKFIGLLPGVTYYFYFYAGNSKGISALSEVRSIMCA